MSIYPNAYYNYLKTSKSVYEEGKESIKSAISKEYHRHGGVPGYRTIHYYIKQLDIDISKATVHKYMNKELNLYSIVRRKYNYQKGEANNVFPNELNMDFTAEKRNQKWCTDFTYLFLTDGRKSYNCTILDIFDRSVVKLTDKRITSDLAIRTLKKALESQPKSERDGILLHSDQGSRYTSHEFTEFCKSVNIKQSRGGRLSL